MDSHSLGDEFAESHCHNDFKLSANNCMVTKTERSFANVFLSKVVEFGVHRWTFKLREFGGNTVVIGVWKANQAMDTSTALRSTSAKGKCYGYNLNMNELTYGEYEKRMAYGSEASKQGDIIDMILDLNKLELRFAVNNKEYGIAHKVKKTRYRAVIHACGDNDCIELVNYNNNINNINVNVNVDDDVKCNKCDVLFKETMALKQTNGVLRQHNDELRYGIANSLKQRDVINETLRTENEELKAIIIELRAEKKEANGLNIKLNEECKDLETDLNEMKEKYKKLFRKCKIDESDYLNWDSDNITDWIVNLHQEYEAYEETLRANLKKEQVDGTLLLELDKNDLHRYGIILLKHKIAICKHIKRFTVKTETGSVPQLQPQLLLPQNEEGDNNHNITSYI